MKDLATQLNERPLPDPDWLWIRAQISLREKSDRRALWASTLRQTLRNGILAAGSTWLVRDWLRTEGLPINPLLIALLAAIVVLALPFLARRAWQLKVF